MVYRLFDVEWGGRQKKMEPGSGEKELRARIDAMEKKEGVQGRPSIPVKEGGDSEDVWGEFMEVEDEAECRRKLDEQRKAPEGAGEAPSRKEEDTKHPGQKRKICRRTVSQQKRRCGSKKRSVSFFSFEKIDKNKMADAEISAERQSLQAGEERRGSNASQTGDGCLETLWQQLIALGAHGIEAFVQRLQKATGAAQGQMPRREEGRRNSEDEQEQGRISQQLVLPTPGGINQGAPASSLEL